MYYLRHLGPLLLLAGCVAQPDDRSVAPQCEIDTDCQQSAGEICDEGICWGGPPAGATFAAVLAPPDERSDLALTEIPMMPIAADGTIDVLEFGESVVVSGRVVLACIGENEPLGCGPDSSVAARVTFERDSRIPGGPRFKRSVQASAGVGPDDEPAFSVRLPALEDDERYTVTIVPEAQMSVEGELVDPAAVAPPARITLDPESETEELMLTVGSAGGLKPIVGVVRTEFDGEGEGVEGMQVFARGRWTGDGPLVRASNVVTTGSDGSFELFVPLAMEDSFDVVARATGELVVPTLERPALEVPDPVGAEIAAPVEIPDMVVPPAPNPAPYVVTIVGTDPSGEEIRISGAEVTVSTVVAPAASDPDTVATYSVTGTTAAEGTVELMLYPGTDADNTRSYELQVLPPAESLSASLFAEPIEVAGVPTSGRGFLQQVSLQPRIPVSGTVVDAAGNLMTETSVAVSTTRVFRNALTPQEQGIVDTLAYPSSVTNDDGGFVVWVDPVVGALPAVYDIELTPPADADAPRWSEDGIEVASSSAASIALGTVQLPPASWARGLVTAGGAPLVGAEVRIYEIDDDLTLCEQVGGGSDCAPTARLRGIWVSGEDGWVRLVLPNP